VRLILNLAGVAALILGVVALLAMHSDIQLGIAVTCFSAAFVLWGLASVLTKLDDMRNTTKP
jgi:hypothetical protein